MRDVKHVLRAWGPVLFWIGLIALESTDTFSSAHTGSFLFYIASALFGSVNLHWLELINAALRKAGHVVGYATLSLLLFRALRLSFGSAAESLRDARRWALYATVLTMAVAALDEFHQSFLPSRTGAVHDVVLDTLAAACMQAAVLITLRLRSRRILQQKSQAAD